MKNLLIICILFMHLEVAYPQSDPSTGSIIVRVANIENKGGIMMIALFTENDDFLEEPSYYQEIPIEDESEIEVTFEKIPFGTYATSIYHDLNENGELDSNFFGIPKEPTGFSNDYVPKFGPPKFKNASFSLSQEELPLTVNLRDY
jgi:uncharacterized protein (DUF2141 family)